MLRIAAICGGNPPAVERVVRALSRDAGVACVVACTGAAQLTETLPATSPLPVVHVRADVALELNHVYLVAEDREAANDNDRIVVVPVHRQGRVDRPLRSIADRAEGNAIVVLVAGSGSDGALGLKRVKETGGIVICESTADGEADELPQAAIETESHELRNPLAGLRVAFQVVRHPDAESTRVARALVLGDFGRLTQVFTNLLSNAVKYTPPGGRLGVEVDVVGSTVVVRVTDTGVGIGANLMPRVFDIFVQCRDELGRSRDGLGIGINVVRRLVESHGGRVYVESGGARPGSCFTVELPLIGDREL